MKFSIPSPIIINPPINSKIFANKNFPELFPINDPAKEKNSVDNANIIDNSIIGVSRNAKAVPIIKASVLKATDISSSELNLSGLKINFSGFTFNELIIIFIPNIIKIIDSTQNLYSKIK